MAAPGKRNSLSSDTKRIKRNNPTPNVLESEQSPCPPQPRVLLHVVDVGHGLAVLVEVFDRNKSQLYLFDTGFQHPIRGGKLTAMYAGNLKRTLENFCYSSSNDSKRLVRKVDGVVISHPHFDHYAGLNYLTKHLPECLTPTKLVVTTGFDPVKLLKNVHCDLLNTQLQRNSLEFSMEVNDCFFGLGSLFRFYFHKKAPPQLYRLTPHLAGPKEESENVCCTESDEHGLSTAPCLAEKSGSGPKKEDVKSIQSTEPRIGSNNCSTNVSPNEASTILRLRPSSEADYPSVVLTGDAKPDRVLEAAGGGLSVFQVPHHGSRCHLPRKLSDKLRWPDHLTLLFALSNRHQSLVPHIEALNKRHALKKSAESFKIYISQIGETLSAALEEKLSTPLATLDNCFPGSNIQVEWYNDHRYIFPDSVIKAVDEEKKKQRGRLGLFKDSLGWAHFYYNVRSDLYVVSAGKPFQQPHAEVLNGIVIACKWRREKCNLVVTNDANLKESHLFLREVRKVASDSTRVWYLNTFDSSISQCSNRPFFTIDPWCLQDFNDRAHHPNPIVAVNPFKPDILCSGLHSLRLEDIRDELDIQNNTSTGRANKLTAAISKGHRRGCSHGIDPPLQDYLTSIGYENPYSPQNVSSVLTPLLGPPIVEQLCSLPSRQGSEQSELLSIVPDLLDSKTKGDSEFVLTETKSAATSARVNVSIPKNKPIQVNSQRVQAASFIVSHARSTNMNLKLKLELSGKKPQFMDVSKHLEIVLDGSSGQTLADYVASLHCDTSTWLSARKTGVGEILTVLLGEEKAIHVVRSFPLFFSFQMSEWSVNHYLTTSVIRDNGTVEEAHIYVKTPIKLPSLLGGKLRLCVEVLVVHIFPGYESCDRGIQIEGECTVNGQHRVRLNSQCGSDFPKKLGLVFTGSFTASDIFHILGINTPNSLEFPFDGGEIQENVTYTIGLNLSQNLPNTTAVELGSLFFQVESEFKHLLPSPLDSIESADVHTTIHYPLTRSPKVGLTASFVFKLEIPKTPQRDKIVVLFDCYFSALPSAANSGYSFGVRVQPHFMPYKINEAIQGATVYDVISVLSTKIGSKVSEELDSMPNIKKQILKRIVMRKLALQISSTAEIQAIELEASVSQLDIVPHKVQITSGMLSLLYSSEDGLQLECSGVLSFLGHSTCSVQVVLPTSRTLGKIHFENDDDNLTLNKTLEAFGWLSHDTLSHPVLCNLLNITLRKIYIHFTQNLEVTQAKLSLYKKELNLGILSLSHVEVDVMLRTEDEQYQMSFSIAAFIADTLYAQLQYSSESRLLTGRVHVTCFSHIEGPDALHAFQLESSDPKNKPFMDLCDVFSKQFMTVFRSSQNQQKAGHGLTGFVDVSISVPLKCTGKYALEHLLLEVKDVLKVRGYIIDTFHFEYSRTPFSEDTSSTTQLLAVIRKLECPESMVIKFDLAAKRSQPSIFTATVEAGPQGGLLKLSSVLDLAGCETPDLPKVDLPPVFDFELKYGAITFALSPFQVYGFDVAILIQHWQVFKDPELTVHNLTVRTTWKSGSLPELTFTDCFLTFIGLELILNGRITPKAVSIDCKTVPQDAKGFPKVVKFESVLKEYSPSTLPSSPVIPKDVGLPPMNVELKELTIHLEEMRKSLRLNSCVAFNDSWSINFGSRPLSVSKLGAALEWEKSNGVTTYRAFIYGSFQLCNLLLEVQMTLGNSTDSIITAEVSTHPDNRPHFGEVADYLLCPDEPTPSQESSIDDLVPPSLKKITSISVAMAFNVTKKQFLLSGKFDRWGCGYLLVGHLHDADEMDYVVSLALEDGFRFSQLSESLSFIDEFVTLRCVNVLVSSVELKGLSDILEPYNQALCQLGRNLQTPFSTLPALPSSELVSEPVKKGTTLYAAIDVNSCRCSKGAISNVFELGDEHLTKCDIIVKVHICSDSRTEAYTKVEFHAWIQKIKLFQLLVFSDIHLLYKLNKPSGFLLQLSGRISLELNTITSESKSNITIDGQLRITDERATFRTHSGSQSVVKRPAGINVEVRDLSLEFVMDLRSGKKDTPDLFISGELILGSFHLVARFLLKGISFKVLHIKLLQGIMLSLLFGKCGVEWTASSLDIGIRKGEFYYARKDTEFIENDGVKHCYEEGYHLESVITLLNTDFRIKADIPHDRKMLRLSGRSVQKIDLGFAKLTGTGEYSDEGPELSYCNRTLCIEGGIEILQQPWFQGSLKYCSRPDDKFFEGSIAYQGRILWIDNPRMTIRWSKRDGFQIVEFPILGDLPFNLLGAIAKFAKVLYNLVCGIFKWNIKLQLRTTRNDNPERYLVKFILTGTLSVTVVGFITIDVIPLPEIPLNLLRLDDFSLSKLPLYILKCMWDSAGEICKSLLSYLNPLNLAKMLGKVIINAITGVIKSVGNVAKKAWGWFKSIFGFSAFIIDSENNTIVGYICGGKGGKDLCDEKYIVTHFGPFLAVHAVGEIATDVHRNAKACIDAKNKIEDTDSLLEDEHTVQLSQLSELQQKTRELSTNLALRAGEILKAGSVSVEIVDGGLSIKWEVSNAEGDVVYSGDKGDIEHHIKILVTTVTVNQDGEVGVESTNVFSKTLTRPDCTIQPKEIQEEETESEEVPSKLQDVSDCAKPGKQETVRKKTHPKKLKSEEVPSKLQDVSDCAKPGKPETVRKKTHPKKLKSEEVPSKLQDVSDCAKPDKQETVRKKTHPKKLKSIQPSRSSPKFPDEIKRAQQVASKATQSRKHKEKHLGKSEQLHPGKQAYPTKKSHPTKQPQKRIQMPTVARKDAAHQSKKHKVTQSVKQKSKDVETDECKEAKSVETYVDVKPEQEDLQRTDSERRCTLVEDQKAEQENTQAESEMEIVRPGDKGKEIDIASEIGTTTENQQDGHQQSTQGSDLHADDNQPCTHPVDALADPDHEAEEQKWLEIAVPMDADVLSKAVCVSVSVQPTVTLKVMTLPPQTSKQVDVEMFEKKDKVWTEQLKREIKEEGREKEVTLFGTKICKDYLTRPSLSAAVQFSSIDFISNDESESLMVFGTLATVPEVNNCLINIVDKNDQIVVVKQLLIPSYSHTSTLEFKLDLHPSDLPKDSQGPYIVAAIALSAEFNTSQSFTVSDIEIPRYPHPEALTQCLPKLDDSTEFYSIDSALDEVDSSEDASDIVRISWSPPQLENELETAYSFVVNLVGTLTSEVKRATKEYLSSELTEQDRLGTDAPTFTLSVPISSSELDVACEYPFSLKNVFSRNGIPLNAGLTLQCEVVTVGSHPEVAQRKLPSMPQLTPQFIVVAPPSKVSLSISDTRPGLLVSWLNSIHALSYRVDIMDEATNTVLLSKAHHCRDKDEKSVYDHFDTDTLLCRNDLMSVPCSDTTSYTLQMYSLGFGEDLLRSLIPTVAGDRLHMFPLEIKYLPESDSIALLMSFNSTPVETPLSVKLYLEIEMDAEELLEQTEIHVLKTKCQFPLYKWRPLLKHMPGSTISAIVHSKNKGQGVICLGVSSTELSFLPSPESFRAMEKYEPNWTVSGVTMNWTATGQLDTPHYRCGFISMVTGSVIFCVTTQETSAKVDIASLPLSDRCIQFNCFVESMGNARAITSNTTLDTTLYQCVTSPAPEDARIIFTSFSLLRVWCWYLGTASSQSYLQIPGKPQYRIIPHRQPFPRISVPDEIMRKFWDTESQCQLLFDNGYLYCFDLLESCESDKWKELYPLKVVKPNPWHRRALLLFYVRCSCKPDVRKWSECYVQYKLQVMSHKSGEQTSTEQTSTGETDGKLKKFLKKGVKKVQEGLKKVAVVLGFSQNSVVAKEESGKVVLKPNVGVRTKDVVHLISSVDFDNLHSVSLNLTQKNCNYEAHLYVRYI